MKARMFFTVLLVSAGLFIGTIIEQLSAGASAFAGSSKPAFSPTAVSGKPAAPDSSTTIPLSEGFEDPSLSLYWSEFDSVVPNCVPPASCGWAGEATVYHGGARAAFAPDVASVSDQQMTLRNPVIVPSDATAASLSFYHKYGFEAPDYDGGVLEVSTDRTTWMDAGSHITSGGYTGTIHSGFQNPLAGRAGWVGTNGASFSQVTVNLLSYAGQTLFFRFRLGSDNSNAATGWYVDDVVLSFTAPLPCTQATWTQARQYPVGVSESAVVEFRGLLYSFGGISSGGVSTVSYDYDPTSDTWSSINALPEARSGAGAVSDGFHIYVEGGDDGSRETNTLYRFDPTTGTWTTMASSPTSTYRHALVYLNGKIYRIAGYANGGTTNSVEVYTIATNTWAAAANYPLAVSALNPVALNGYIYTAGGVEQNSNIQAKTYRYDPASNSWNDSAIADLPSTSGRVYSESGLLNGRWIIASGVGYGYDGTISSYVWNPSANEWSSMAHVPVRITGAGAAVIGQSLYLVGGSQGSQGRSAAVQKYTEPACSSTPAPSGTASRTVTRTRTPTATATPTQSAPTATPIACTYSYATGSSSVIPGTTDIGNHCDDCTTLINLPFPFHLYDQTFNSVYVSSNGNAQFATDTNDYQLRCLPSTTLSSYVILPYWTDLRTDGTGQGIFTAVQGTAPARVFVIEWRVGLLNTSGSADFALYLYESSAVKRFNIIYGHVPEGYTNFTVGVQKNGTTFTEYSCNGAGGSITNGLLISFTESCGTPTATPTSPSQASPTPTQCNIQFSDVPPGSTFYPYVRCMVCRGIISGYPDGTFHPNANVTRGQLAKIVSNAAGFSDTQSTQLFQDVPAGSTFFQFIGRLASRGFMSGYTCGGTGEPCGPANLPYFRPNNNATRGQISKIVSNAAGFNDPPGAQIFQDVPPSSTFYDYIQRLASRNVMGGYQCGGAGEPCVPPGNLPYFRPNNNATRGQTTKIVTNALLPDCNAMLP